MDRNTIIGFILMALVTLAYFMYFAPEVPEEEATPPRAETEQLDEALGEEELAPEVVEVEVNSDSLRELRLDRQFGAFAPLTTGESTTYRVVTDELTVDIDTRGGVISQALLNHHVTDDSALLPIIPAGKSELYFTFTNKSTLQPISSKDLLFEPAKALDAEIRLSGEESETLRFVAQIDAERYVEQVYTFSGEGYAVDYTINFVGLRPLLKNSYYELKWNMAIPRTERAIDLQRQKTQLVYQLGDGDMERLGGGREEAEKESITGDLSWVSFKSQFFSAALIARDPLRNPILEVSTPENEEIARVMNGDFRVDLANRETNAQRFTFFLGPNKYELLNAFDVDLEDQMDLGYLFIPWINVGTIYVFRLMEKFTSNYGLIILFFAILVKLIVFPLTYRSYVSMAKLRVLNQTPEMKQIDEKFKDDAQKQQLEKMNIYRTMGVSPLGGCVPMLLQYPILISMFFFFPQAVELRHESFLWADDLSTYDSIFTFPNGFSIPGYGDHISLFCLLMTVSIYGYTYLQQKSQSTATSAQFPFMKYLPYIFPLMFLVFLNNYASGLSWYYFASNLISIIQTTVIRARLDDDKLLDELHRKSRSRGKKGKKGKKGGKGGDSGKPQSRIQRWVAKQQQKQEQAMRDRQANQGANRRSRRQSQNKSNKKRR